MSNKTADHCKVVHAHSPNRCKSNKWRVALASEGRAALRSQGSWTHAKMLISSRG